MTDLDLDCAAAAMELLNPGRDEALAMAALRQSITVEAAVISALADRRADKPRRNRTIRVVYDDDGVAIGTEDVGSAPAAESVGEAAPESATPAGGLFADVFGSVDGLGGS
jgi:hypothetical protein